jgi:hypothetical protein
MMDFAKILIVDMSPTFAFVAAVFVVCAAIIVATFRTSRAAEIRRQAKEEVRTQELNQINHALAYMKQQQEHRIHYLEGRVKGATGENV